MVEKAKQERQQKIVQAEGEAESAKLIGLAIGQNPGYLKLRKLKASQNIAKIVTFNKIKYLLKPILLILSLLKQIANSNNRAFLNSSSLMLDITDNKFDVSTEKLRNVARK